MEALQHGVLPASLYGDEPTEKVEWDGVRLLSESVEWPAGDRPRRAGISGFGISGTNAHVILEEAPQATSADAAAPRTENRSGGEVAWLLSAKSPAALREQAARLHAHVSADPALDVVDVAHSLATTRGHLDHRAAVIGHDRTRLLADLHELSRGGAPGSSVRGTAGHDRRLAVLFTGQGSQYAGMGRQLAEAHPVFKAALDETIDELDRHLDRPLRPILHPEDGEDSLLHQTAYTQPALFALEVALFRLVESWGLRPDFLLGHSVGEVTCAHVAGALSLRDAALLVTARGRLMQQLPSGGAMLAVEATEDEMTARLADRTSGLCVAAVNGPRSLVVSGPENEITAAAAQWQQQGRRTRRLQVSHAFHSSLMDPALDELADALRHVEVRPPTIPIISNVTGVPLGAAELTGPEYWVRHARQPVRFQDGMRWLGRTGVRNFLELGPSGVLTALARDCLAESGHGTATTAAALGTGQSEPESLISAVSELHVHGVRVEWGPVFAGRAVPLPTYAFQHRRYWPDAAPDQPLGTVTVTPAVPGSVDAAEPTHEEEAPPAARIRSTEDALALVLAEAAAVMGHGSADDVAPDRPFAESGMDSMGMVRFHKRVIALSGLVDLPAATLVEHPTPLALAERLAHLTAAGRHDDERATTPPPAPGAGSPSGPATGTLVTALRRAREADALAEMLPVLAGLSRFGPPSGARAEPSQPLLITDGPAAPTVVCVPSFMAGSGPHQFIRLAGELSPRLRTHGLTLPGFADGAGPPATWREATDALAESTLRAADGNPFVLLGQSIGGVLAHATARRLCETGNAPAGIVMIDTFDPEPAERGAVFAWAMRQILDRDPEGVVVTEDNVAAMGTYLHLVDEWEPGVLDVPVLLLRAEPGREGSGAQDGAPGRPWRTAGTVVPIDADHFSIIEQHAERSAAAVQKWLTELEA
ncbi:alpha/beta fold hydrolase [Streptomyces sp. NPDC047315]|uniref:alpha/beta fold hydrolase n=1 Tax=Streptomyces sp. NPDC047315 TaxID=3155142 RepID=UPI0033E909D5